MKKSLLTAFFIVVCLGSIMAQIPQAFKYQAVIRDIDGVAITDRDINLRISIIAGNPDGIAVYSETHIVTTNSIGLVNLEVGRGISPSSNFAEINWAGGNYYIRIDMDENGGSNFKPLGVSQLLAVPYALHAGTAGNISATDRTTDDGIPSNTWSTFGNTKTSPETDKLGTTDNADLKIVTNNIDRFRIFADGNGLFARSLEIGENFEVNGNVLLNTTSGATDNFGPFTVSHLSPTLLSGTLTVDGATDLNSSLNVDGITNLNSNFNVNNASPSHLTGTLLVNQDGTFDQHVFLTNPELDATSTTTGALVVGGGVGIGKNLYVGGNAVFAGPLAVTNTNESESTTTGALTVAGGVGIAKRLNVGGYSIFSNNMDINGQLSITSNPNGGNQDLMAAYPLVVKGGSQGIAIKVNGSRSTANNFISFWDDSKMQGRVEGQTTGELWSDPEYVTEFTFKTADVVLYAAEQLIGLAETGQSVVKLSASAASSTACVGLGACITAPIPSLIVESSTNLVVKIANAVLIAVNLSEKIAQVATFTAFKNANIGITYQSGAGDYAEWLPKRNAADVFMPGELVGIKNGFVSSDLQNADNVMVVSTNPIVLGNMPPQGLESNFVKIAFMGQVPMKVIGEVKPGDYIVPSEMGGGFGKAVSPDKMELKDYRRIAGVAWSDMNQITPGINMVNVAVGINSNDLAGVIYKQDEKFNNLKAEYDNLKAEVQRNNAILAQLVPGFAEATGYQAATDVDAAPSKPEREVISYNESNITYSNPEDIIYFEFSKEQVAASIDLARENYYQDMQANDKLFTSVLGEKYEQMKNGKYTIPIEEHPFWKKIDSDPQYKEEIIQFVKDKLEQSIYTQRKYLSNFTGMKIKE